jgi:CheY-like chemotaxis protein/Tfp pilus assembly protein PilZ
MAEDIRILFSDRDNVFLELCKTYLKTSGVSVLTCDNGKDALDIIRNKNPHLVFLSADMPIINGLDCCRTVRMDESLDSIPILITLSCGKKDNIESCNQAGCNDVLLKPINRHTFFSVIKKYITMNKRAAPRFAACFHVEWKSDNGRRSSGNTVDISTQGLFIETKEIIPVNSIIDLDFIIPNSNIEINCRAKVRWINKKDSSAKSTFPSGIGVQFADLNEDNYRYICEYITKEHVEPILQRIY